MNKQEERVYDILTRGCKAFVSSTPGNLPWVIGNPPKNVDYVIAAKLCVAFPTTLFSLTREVTRQVLKDGSLENRLEISWLPLPSAPGAQAVDAIVSKEFNGIFYKNRITYRADT